MNIKIDGEEIDGIDICEFINYLSKDTIKDTISTYNFNAESQWTEFYVAVNKRLSTKKNDQYFMLFKYTKLLFAKQRTVLFF